MKETRMPPARAGNLVANSGNALYGVKSIVGSLFPCTRIITRFNLALF